jgi:hypothetical protein
VSAISAVNMVTDASLATVTGSSFEICAFSEKATDEQVSHKKQAKKIKVTCFIASPHTQQISENLA